MTLALKTVPEQRTQHCRRTPHLDRLSPNPKATSTVVLQFCRAVFQLAYSAQSSRQSTPPSPARGADRPLLLFSLQSESWSSIPSFTNYTHSLFLKQASPPASNPREIHTALLNV